jgi:hypothetical protein
VLPGRRRVAVRFGRPRNYRRTAIVWRAYVPKDTPGGQSRKSLALRVPVFFRLIADLEKGLEGTNVQGGCNLRAGPGGQFALAIVA